MKKLNTFHFKYYSMLTLGLNTLWCVWWMASHNILNDIAKGTKRFMNAPMKWCWSNSIMIFYLMHLSKILDFGWKDRIFGNFCSLITTVFSCKASSTYWMLKDHKLRNAQTFSTQLSWGNKETSRQGENRIIYEHAVACRVEIEEYRIIWGIFHEIY